MSDTYNKNMAHARACVARMEKEERDEEQEKQSQEQEKQERNNKINREKKQRIVNIKEQEEKKAGFIVLSRDIMQSSVWSNPSLLQFYIYCIMRANFEDKTIVLGMKSVRLKRGQFVTSTLKLAKDLCITRQKVRTRLNLLISTNKITSKTTNKFTVISVSDYDYWQGKQQTKQPSKQQTNNHQITTDNNVNNFNNKKLKIKKEKIRDYFVNSISVYEKVLADFYFEKGLEFENVEMLKRQVLEDSQAYAHELKVISGLKQEEYLPIMANISQHEELSLGACVRYIQQDTVKQDEKQAELKQDLADKLGFNF